MSVDKSFSLGFLPQPSDSFQDMTHFPASPVYSGAASGKNIGDWELTVAKYDESKSHHMTFFLISDRSSFSSLISVNLAFQIGMYFLFDKIESCVLRLLGLH